MNRVRAAGSVVFANRDISPGSGTPQYFTNGNPLTSVPATVLPGYFVNMSQDELMTFVSAAGLSPDDTNWSQVWQSAFKAFTFPDAGVVNALAVNLPAGTVFPSSALGAGTTLKVQAAFTNTTTTPTLNLFGIGAVTIVRQDGNPLFPADIQAGQYFEFVYDGTHWRLLARAQLPLGAGLNKVRNSSFLVAQRTTSGTITAGTPAYTIDGHIVGSTGANVTWQQTTPIGLAPASLVITGAAGVTDAFLSQLIEGQYAIPLASRGCIFQAKINNNSGASITPTLTVKHANSSDIWSASTTDVNAVALQACPNGVTTQVFFSFSANALVGNGLSLRLDFGGGLNGAGKQVTISDVDLRADSVLNPPEIGLYHADLLWCQRYLPGLKPLAAGNAGPGGVIVDNTHAGVSIPYYTPSRVSVTGLSLSAVADWQINAAGTPTSLSTFVWNGSSATGALLLVTGAGGAVGSGGFGITQGATNLIAQNTGSWLVLTGAELNGTAI